MNSLVNTQGKNRILYFDLLRLFATLGVIILHISSSNWYLIDVRSFSWQVFNITDSLVRWSVPVFVMLSGALFLKHDISIARLHGKYILRIITAFAFWSVVYALADHVPGSGKKGFVLDVVTGHYHMWFLYMIAGLYLIVPFLRKFIDSDILLKYFLLLSLVFAFILPQLIPYIQSMDADLGNAVNSAVNKINFHFAMGYIAYFVLGYYLSTTEISSKARSIIYALSILSFIITIVGTSLTSINEGNPSDALYGYFTVNVLLESIGVFVFFRYRLGSVELSQKLQSIITRMSKYSFGAYLVHVLILEKLSELFGIDTLMCNPVVSVLLLTAIVSCCSFAVSYVCNQIPILKKYIV